MAFNFWKRNGNGNGNNGFYRDHTHQIIYVVTILLVLVIAAVNLVLYQQLHKPNPPFYVQNDKGNVMSVVGYMTPNLTAPTILRWASKAATLAYTFSFRNYPDQMALIRPYFTPDGWRDYQASLSGVISTIVQRQLFTTAVVSGPPVISNQGYLTGSNYAWRVQIPFLVTYASAGTSVQRNFFVILTITSVPTTLNPQGIGIDQFVMVTRT